MAKKEQENKYKELAKQVKLPALSELSEEQVDRLYEMVSDGASQQDVDAFLGTAKKSYSQEEVDEIVRLKTQELMKARPVAAPVAVAQAPQVVIAEKPEKKPHRPSGIYPAADRAEKPLTVYVPGHAWVLTHFIVRGAAVDPPRSQVIPFKKYQGEAAQRFGRSVDISHRCFYTTWDKKEIDLFLSDDRWGGFFYTDEEGSKVSGMEIFTRAYSKYYASFMSMGMQDLRSQITAGADVSMGATIHDMRVKLATHMAVKEVEERGGRIEVEAIESAKEQLMARDGRR